MGNMSVLEAQEHAGKFIQSSWIEEHIRPVAVDVMPHYLFTEGDEKHRQGWCSACEEWVDVSPERLTKIIREPDDEEYPQYIPVITDDWKFRQGFDKGRTLHNHTGFCPRCGARVTFRGLWRGHRSLEDKRFLIHYEKSPIDPKNTVVCVGYRLHTEWREMDPMRPDVPVEIRPQEICIFKSGEGGERFILEDSRMYGSGWVHRKKCGSGYAPGLFGNKIQTVLDNYSFIDAVRGTPFEKPTESGSMIWSTVQGEWFDRISIMAGIAKYPCIEYLLKLEMDEIANDLFNGWSGNLINRKGKTAKEVLRLTDSEWGEVKGRKLRLTPDALKVHRLAKRKKWRISMELIDWCGRRRGDAEQVRVIASHMPAANTVKLLKYCRKKGVSLKDYADHMSFMRTLGMDEQDSEFLYPKDFSECHAELARRISNAKEVAESGRILSRILEGELDEYFFSAMGFTLRPAFTAGEIAAEGKTLKHCVGGYVDRYAEGGTNICFLRNEDEPNKPRYTVEFGKTGQLIQCRGYGNDMGKDAQAQKRADAQRLEMFWRLHEMYRKDLKAMKKKEARRKAA